MHKKQEPLSSMPVQNLLPQQTKPFRRRGRRFKQLISITLLSLAGLFAYDLYSTLHFFNKINEHSGNAVSVLDAWQGESRVNILLLGVDNRDHDPHPRSDSMIVVSVDPVSKQVDLISVLRDSFVSIPGHGKDKVNAAYAYGGQELAVQTVKNFLNIPIQYYIVTDFEGFKGVVDAIGGIDFNVEKDMDYQDDGVYDIHLKKGMQHLDGTKALMYVRFRHDEMSDFSRTERQRNILKALASKLTSPAMILRLPSLEQAAEGYLKTNIAEGDVLRLGYLFTKVSSSRIEQLQVPPMNGLDIQHDDSLGDILVPDLATSREAVRNLFGQAASGAAALPEKTGVIEKSGSSSAAAPAGADSFPYTAIVQGEGVRVRKGPSTSDEVITSVTQGDQVTVLSTDAGWDFVQLESGVKGYMAAQFLRRL